MVKKLVNRKNALLVMEVAIVGFLCWMVLASNLITQPGSKVEARSQDPQKSQIKKQKQAKKDRRWLPTEGVPEERNVRVVAQLGTPNGCTGFEFAGGATEGFTVVPTFGTPLALWHVTNSLCRAFLTGHSTPYTFYYGQDATCNYNTGARNAANLISPAISLVGKFPPYSIGFNYLLFVEGGGFDSTFVDISTDGGTTWTQVASKANMINDNQWHNIGIDVTAVVGAASTVRVRYRFDSVDNIANSTTGWHVDDVVVCGQPFNFCLQSDNGTNILQFNSITGAYTFTQCGTGFTRSGVGTVVSSGGTVTLSDTAFDHFVNATVNTSTHAGSASLKYVIPPKSVQAFNIIDSDTTNNTCTCP
jgi:hypothetical protein